MRGHFLPTYDLETVAVSDVIRHFVFFRRILWLDVSCMRDALPSIRSILSGIALPSGSKLKGPVNPLSTQSCLNPSLSCKLGTSILQR